MRYEQKAALFAITVLACFGVIAAAIYGHFSYRSAFADTTPLPTWVGTHPLVADDDTDVHCRIVTGTTGQSTILYDFLWLDEDVGVVTPETLPASCVTFMMTYGAPAKCYLELTPKGAMRATFLGVPPTIVATD